MFFPLILKTILLVFIVYLSSYLLFIFFGQKGARWIPLLIGVIGVTFQVLINRQESFGILGFGFASIMDYLHVIMVVVDILLLVFIIGNITENLKFSFDWDLRLVFWALRRIAIKTIQGGIIAILSEELIFRGLVQRQLSLSLSPVAAILIASILFGIWRMLLGGLIHRLDKQKNILYGLGAGLLGMVFGNFYHQSGSLIVAGFAHGLWDAIVYLFWGIKVQKKTILETKNDALTHPEYGWIGTGVLAAAVPILYVIIFHIIGKA
jgi:membrane protease YdiL (CAAX protease family)